MSDALWLEKRSFASNEAFLWAVIVQCHSAQPLQNPSCGLREQIEPPEVITDVNFKKMECYVPNKVLGKLKENRDLYCCYYHLIYK